MKLKAFAVHDSKVKAFQSPFFTSAAGHAIRSFEAAVNDEKTTLSTHPEDFTLFEVGEYDDQTGTFTNHAQPTNLGTALNFKKLPSSQPPLFQKIQNSQSSQLEQ